MSGPYAGVPHEQPNELMIRAIVADDECLARKKLRILLGSEPQIEVVAECPNGKQTVPRCAVFARYVFLDIQMPDLDGFEVLSEISPEEMPQIIFTSAYDRYGIPRSSRCSGLFT